MQDKALLFHGFADDNGRNTTDLLRPFFEASNFLVEEYDYGWTGLLGVALLNGRRAKEVARKVTVGTVGVGHSNGCAILQKASLLGAPFSQLVFINPALDSNAKIGEQVRWVHVWHSPSDVPLGIAQRFFRFLSWGDMGKVGYDGWDSRFINYDKENDFEVSSCSHLDIFQPDKLAFFGPRIVGALNG